MGEPAAKRNKRVEYLTVSDPDLKRRVVQHGLNRVFGYDHQAEVLDVTCIDDEMVIGLRFEKAR